MYGAALSANAQMSLAMAQIQAARARQPLAALSAEVYDATWLERPTNDLGAHLRVAYWLGAAARPRTPGGPPNLLALSYAEQALSAAQHEQSQPFISNPFSSEEAHVDQILADGERAAQRAGRTDAAALLNRVRGGYAENQGFLESLVGSPEARARLALGWGASGTTFAIIAGAGLVLYLVIPLLLPSYALLKRADAADEGMKEVRVRAKRLQSRLDAIPRRRTA